MVDAQQRLVCCQSRNPFDELGGLQRVIGPLRALVITSVHRLRMHTVNLGIAWPPFVGPTVDQDLIRSQPQIAQCFGD